MTKIQMNETVLCDIRFRNCNLVCLFLSLEHSSFEFVSDFDIRISNLDTWCQFRHLVSSFSAEPIDSDPAHRRSRYAGDDGVFQKPVNASVLLLLVNLAKVLCFKYWPKLSKKDVGRMF